MIATADTFDLDALPSPVTASAYRRRARQLRHRFRNDLPSLHLSLKSLATEVDEARAAASPEASRDSVTVRSRTVVRPRRVEARVVYRGDALSVADSDSNDAVAAENADAARRIAQQTATIAAGLETPAPVVEQFSQAVRSMLGEGVLRYDQRRALYHQAARLKIDRFEASLIIAAIEHRHGLSGSRPAHPSTHTSSGTHTVGRIIGAALVLEAAVLLAAWAFFG